MSKQAINSTGIADCTDYKAQIDDILANAQYFDATALRTTIIDRIGDVLKEMVKAYDKNIVASQEKYEQILKAKVAETAPESNGQEQTITQSEINSVGETGIADKSHPTSDALQEVVSSLNSIAMDASSTLVIMQSNHLNEITAHINSLDDAALDRAFIKEQSQHCQERGDIYWTYTAVIDHEMAQKLSSVGIKVDNFVDLNVDWDAVENRTISEIELKSDHLNRNELQAATIYQVCSSYADERMQLANKMKIVDSQLVERYQKIADTPSDLKYVWNLMRQHADETGAKTFDSKECTTIGNNTFAEWADQNDFHLTAVKAYGNILLKMNSDLEQSIAKVHLVNYVLSQLKH